MGENYIGEPDRTALEITIRNNLSIAYEIAGDNQKALIEIEECIRLASTRDYGHLLAPLLTAKSFNIIRMVKKGYMQGEKLVEAQKLSQQAYYIAVARGDFYEVESIKKFYSANLEMWFK